MKIRFWGVRGSIASPGRDTAEFGGNTSCYEVESAGGTRVILDAGTGMRPLGNLLLPLMPLDLHVFVSHTHWDHIQGFPFFSPAFVRGNNLHMYGPALHERTLEGAMRTQMDYTFFPVRESELRASLTYRNLKEETLTLGDLTVRCKYTNHPVLTLSFRIEDAKHSLVYSGDMEPYYNILQDPRAPLDPEELEEIEAEVRFQNARHVAFCQGADVLIHDAQYTRAEYESQRRGWGHCAMEDAIDIGLRAGVKRLVLSHHDPTSTDPFLAAAEKRFQDQVAGTGMKLCFAREGLVIMPGED